MEKRELTALAKTLGGVMRQALDSMSARLDAFDQRFKEIPAVKDGKDADPELVKSLVAVEVKAAVDALPVPKDGKDGRDGTDGQSIKGEPGIDGQSIKGDPGEPGRPGKDAEPEQIREAVRQAVAEIPVPKDGRDGKDAGPVDIDAIITEAVKRIPVPQNGKDADPEAVREWLELAVAQAIDALPKPKDGEPGRDGKSVDPDEIQRWVIAEVEKIVAAMPKPENGKDGERGEQGPPCDIDAVIAEAVKRIPVPKDGIDGKSVSPDAIREMVAAEVAALPPAKNGKDAEPIHPDTISLMVAAEVQKQVAAIPKAKDGVDGEPGRDAPQIDILPHLDPLKSFPRGTFGSHEGGLIRSKRQTTPGRAIDLSEWDVIVDSPGRVRVIQGEDPRDFTFEIKTAGGAVSTQNFFIPAIIYQGMFRDGEEYTKGHAVTSGGSMWQCLAEKTKMRPGAGCADWVLIVKEGRPGKNGELPKPPEPPKPVRLG